jgi:hypothetical protein
MELLRYEGTVNAAQQMKEVYSRIKYTLAMIKDGGEGSRDASLDYHVHDDK